MPSRYLLVLASFFASIVAQSSLCVTATGTCFSPPKQTCGGKAPPGQTSCAEKLHIIISRGTTECMGFGNSYCVAKAVKDRLGDTAVTVDYTNYPADADLTGKVYVDSETKGVINLNQTIRDYVNRCPGKPIIYAMSTTIRHPSALTQNLARNDMFEAQADQNAQALIGYSQGAHVTGDVLYGSPGYRRDLYRFPITPALPTEYAKSVVAVILFGDPTFVKDKIENVGSYEGKDSWFPRTNNNGLYGKITQSYCNFNDTFCDCGEYPRYHCAMNEARLATHKTYVFCNVYTQDAANFIAGRVNRLTDSPDWKSDLK